MVVIDDSNSGLGTDRISGPKIDEELFDAADLRFTLEQRHNFVNLIIVKIPPTQITEQPDDLLREAIAHDFGRIACNDCVGRYVAGYNGFSGHDTS